MKVWRLGAALILAAWVAGCGGNSTPIGVTVAPAGTSTAPFTVLLGETQQFTGIVGGSTTTGVTWSICLPAATATTLPTNCPPGFGTINVNGLYTPPASIPNPNLFNVVATSVANPNVFGVSFVSIASGVRVQVTPTSATIGTGETLQVTASVTGAPNNSSFSFVVSGNGETGVPGGDLNTGVITPAGLFTASNTAGAITITAISAQDSSQTASVNVTVSAFASPTLANVNPIDPSSAAQGSIQQDVFIRGTNFFSTSTVLANGVPVPTTFISTTTLRATIPAAELTGIPASVPIVVQAQNGIDKSGSANLQLNPVRPAIIALAPDSVTQTSTSAVNVNLIGGYFSPFVAGFFNGQPLGAITVTTPRQVSVSIQQPALSTPGLYPIVVQNQNPLLAAPAANMSAVNLAVEPSAGSLASAPIVPAIAVGNAPSAVAINPATGTAIVANTADGTISIFDLTANSPTVTTVPVGNQPTGVAVDDQLSVALVVNSADNTISVVNLISNTVTSTVPLGAFTPSGSNPFSIGINSLTHRAFVADTSTNEGTILDLVNATPSSTPPCNVAPCPVGTVGGAFTNYSTGPTPAIAIDPRVNWAVITPGGTEPVNIVDLGRAASPGDGGRAPVIVATLQLGVTVQGVAIDTETHKVLLTTPNQSTLTTFSLLDQSVGAVNFATTQLNLVASAINPLSNVGMALNNLGNTAAIVDLQNGVPLGTVTFPAGSAPQAVAVDPGTSRAVVANQGNGTVSIASLGAVRDPHIVEASPAIAFAPAVNNLALNIIGHGFLAGTGTTVLLDGTQVPANVVSDRQISATVPAAMLASARRYIVTVQNSLGLSNATDLTVIQPVEVGTAPFGVAVDTDRDIAAVTNSADGTLSFVDLTKGTVLQTPTLVGSNPQGVAMIPRLGLAVVANFGSNNVSIVNEDGSGPTTVALCPSCFEPVGVAVNQDTQTAAITNSLQNNTGAISSVSFINITSAGVPTLGFSPQTDQDPVAVAIDPALNLAAVACELVPTSATVQGGALDVGPIGGSPTQDRVSGLQIPTGVIFDPVNQVFLVANSANNDIVIADPTATFGTTLSPTLTLSTVPTGIDPTSLDYNFQTSTLVTLNSSSNTLSVLDYVCPPVTSGGTPSNCPATRVREVLGLNSAQSFSTLLQFAVAIDPTLNLAVVVDMANNRVLLVPLPH